jgi:hypothetical protein
MSVLGVRIGVVSVIGKQGNFWKCGTWSFVQNSGNIGGSVWEVALLSGAWSGMGRDYTGEAGFLDLSPFLSSPALALPQVRATEDTGTRSK